MNLSVITNETLVQMGKSTDSQMKGEYEQSTKLYANDCIADLADHIGLWRTDAIAIASGVVNLGSLPRIVKRVLSIKRDNRLYEFERGESTGLVYIEGLKTLDGTVSVTYTYVPARLTSENDEPELPTSLHQLIPTYTAARTYLAGDTEQQRRGLVLMQQYENLKSKIPVNYGESNSGRIMNKFI